MKKSILAFFIGALFLVGVSSCGEDFGLGFDPCDCNTELSTSVNYVGTTQVGSGCNNNTLNSCGYCYLHTDQCFD